MRNAGIKKSFALLLALVLVFSSFGSVLAKTDINGHWAQDEINSWIEQGLIDGYNDGSFKPDRSITRAEFVALVNRSMNYSETEATNFTDVSAGIWYYDEVGKASREGYIKGYDDNSFRPNNNISREEAAVIIERITSLNAGDNSVNSFADSHQLSWSKASVDAVVTAGIMKGYKDNTFRPTKPITRAEAVVTLDRVLALTNEGSEEESNEEETNITKTYDQPGEYGTNEVTTIEGNVSITSKDVTLQNMVINGDLVIAKAVDNGEVYLNNVEVTGNTEVNGGGENSVYLTNSTLSTVSVNKEDSKIRLVASGSTNVGTVTTLSGVKLEEETLTGDGFGEVIISSENTNVTLDGLFTKVQVDGEDTTLTILLSSVVDRLVVNAAADIKGKGSIKLALINVNGVTMTMKPDEVKKADGVAVSISESSGPKWGGGSSDADVSLNPSSPEIIDIQTQLNNQFGSNPALDSSVTLSGLNLSGFDGSASDISFAAVDTSDTSLFGQNTSGVSRTLPGQIGSVFEFETNGKTFTSANLTFDVSNVNNVNDLNSLTATYYNETSKEFEFLPTTVDATNKKVTFTTTHNSKYLLVDVNEWARKWQKELDVTSSVYNSEYVDYGLVVDGSGSMYGNYYLAQQAVVDFVAGYKYDDQSAMKSESVTSYVYDNATGTWNKETVTNSVYTDSDRFSLINFSSYSEIFTDFTAYPQTVADAIYKDPSWGGTNISGAIAETVSVYDSVYGQSTNRKIALLFTDGYHNGSFDWQPVYDAVDKNITIITVGLGSNIDMSLLKDIADRTGGQFYQVTNPSELSTQFTNIRNFTQNITVDTDGDGISDYQEVVGLRLKNGVIVHTDPNNADTDGDGFNDNVELGNVVNVKLVPPGQNKNGNEQFAPPGNSLIGQVFEAYDFVSLPDDANSVPPGN